MNSSARGGGSAPAFPEITINTERLTLRALEPADAELVAELYSDELSRQWTTVPQPYGSAEAEALVTGGKGFALGVTEFLTQRLVGVLRLRATDWRLRATEAVVVIAPWARGEGYAGESILAVAQWLFEDQKFERLELRTASGNAAALQVAQKIGCVSEGVLRGAWLDRAPDAPPGSRSDVIVWSLLPEDFL
ncbi:GNAT family N-acetyltransferase [Streptacidiphilus monticola]|jgi:RimJ/RimL family protein N-acetyltransferase|uniref:GNAT family N-acetyltransferase n=1 Tax=Streptacidiphilus monticola TaxID=2161674 RepID=A0ABW1G7D7_9ACTN